MKLRILAILAIVLPLAARSPIPTASTQLVVVTTPSWSAAHGTLRLFRKDRGRWHRVLGPVPVVVGKRGMGWGIGLFVSPRPGEPRKKEGDRKAPAGVFALPFAFGERAMSIGYPYRRMVDTSRCVDDPRSRYYNRIIDARRTVRDYRSFERMKFPSGLYRYGVFVAHNPRSIPGKGSCIFLHIRRSDGRPTVGCTAMDVDAIRTLLRRLDPTRHPVLVQAPLPVIGRLLPKDFPLTKLR
ncbi:L,D-transpeptidase family protein [Nitratifractor sp.]